MGVETGHRTMSPSRKWRPRPRALLRIFLSIGRGRRVHTGRAERGQSAVELALVLPFLFLVVLGIFKFGVVYNNYIQLTNAVDSGARLFAIERGQLNPCTDTVAAMSQATNLNNQQLGITITTGGSSYVWANGAPQAGATCMTLTANSPATVTATYPCDLKIFNLSFSCSLSVSATEDVE
jgi:Flp pilus assembly protein TadG